MTGLLAEWSYKVEEGKVREFARAVHAPVRHDGPVVVPTTFPVVASAQFIERLIVDHLRLDRSRAVHGEESYEYFGAIEPGDTLLCSARVLSDTVKEGRRGGRMRIMSIAIDYVSERSGALVCRQTTTSIEKEQAA